MNARGGVTPLGCTPNVSTADSKEAVIGTEVVAADQTARPTVVPDVEEIKVRADVISHLLQAHGGGIDVLPSVGSDVLRVRFTGLCTNCCLRPLTMATIVRPLLGDVDGVRSVEVEGMRISDEAMDNLLRDVGGASRISVSVGNRPGDAGGDVPPRC